MTDPIALVQEVKASIEPMKEKIQNLDGFLKEMKDTDIARADAASKEAIAAANKAAEEILGVAAKVNDLEQKLFDNVQQGKAAPKTLGQLVLETDAYKSFIENNGKNVSMMFEGPISANTITGQEGSPPANSDVLAAPDRASGIVPGAFRRLKVKDVLRSVPIATNSSQFTRETAFTNNAAETAEGDTRPQSEMLFDLVTANVATIGHFIKVSEQIREDAPALMGYVDGRMSYGVDVRIDNQLLLGNGTGQNLTGLLVGDNYTSFSPTLGETQLDSLNRMKYAVDASDYMADFAMLNPVTWGEIERIKGDDDHYVIGNPLTAIGPFLWGLPVIVTNAMPQGKAAIGNREVWATIRDRQQTVVKIYEQDDTNAQKGLLTIAASARLGLEVPVPAASRYGALTSPGASA